MRDGNERYTTVFMSVNGIDLFIIAFTSKPWDIDALFPLVSIVVRSFKVT